MAKTTTCESIFGNQSVEYEGMLVIGRSHHMDFGERARLNWRKQHMVLNSKKIHCITFDELLSSVNQRLDMLALLASSDASMPRRVGSR
jgi:hypothetical protein